uniref:Protein NDNF n=1 Tax=Myotis lucifugus TaxID=59463 RepID=G1P5K7_MYOLU
MAPLPLWLLWLLLPLGPRAQKLPTRDEELFQMQVRDKAFFHDSSVLPDGAEISSYLFRDTPKRYFFVVEEDNTPLSVTVTPCDTPLEWRLSLQELPEEASGQGSGEQRAGLRGAAGDKAQGNMGRAQVSSGQGSGEQRGLRGAAGDKAQGSSGQVSGEQQEMGGCSGRSPGAGRGRLARGWPWMRLKTRGLVHEFVHHCGPLSWLAGSAKTGSPTSPEGSWIAREHRPDRGTPLVHDHGQGGTWEVGQPGRNRGRAPGHVQSLLLSPNRLDPSSKLTYLWKPLPPGVGWLFKSCSVFPSSLPATGIAMTVGNAAGLEPEGLQAATQLGPDSRLFSVFQVRPVSSHQKVAFFVHSCLDAVRVQVRRDGKLVLSQSVEGVRQFLLRGRPKAKYLLRLKGSRKGASLLKVLASTRPGKHAFPSLPEDTRIKAFDRLRTCSSATVAWLGTQERSKFCLYKKEVGDPYSEDQRKREQNQCLGPDTRAKSEKVLCKYFHSRNPQRAVTTETVRGLQPGKAYLLDVYLVGHGGHSVKYQSKVVKTRRVC